MAIDNEKISLTKEDADFVEDLINKYRYIIISAVNAYLDQSVSYLFEDCISEIYLIACRNVSDLKTHPEPGGWMALTAKYTARRFSKEELRRLRKMSEIKYESPNVEEVSEVAIYNVWLEEKIPEKILSTLTKREKEVYEILYIRGITTDAAAKELGVSHSTIRNINKSIRDKVKYYIKKHCR